MVYQAEDRAKTRKHRAEVAIQLALQGRWEEAAALNRSILEAFPTDVDACNRLGKAMTELGRYDEAREAYQKSLEIDPLNSISRKNLSRLASLGKGSAPRKGAQKISPQMFIEEMGKTGATTLVRSDMEIAARMTAGDLVNLTAKNGSLTVVSLQDERIGEVEPKLAQRLIKLLDGGNQYVAAIAGIREGEVRVFIRETFQHPSQLGKLSFPPTVTETFRPYVKERLVRKDSPDEPFYESDESDDWEGRSDADEAEKAIHSFDSEETDEGSDEVEDEEE